MSEPLITAVVCTYNRADLIGEVLRSLGEQTLPDEKYEVVLVDNNSTDQTPDVVGAFVRKHDNFRYVQEREQGLSPARNRGYREARGRFVAYLDDDAVAAPYWLERIMEVFQSVSPTPGCVGGRLDLIWDAPRPAWVNDRMLVPLGKLDLSDAPCFLEDGEPLNGGNMAFPRDLLVSLGGFHTGLGRRGGNLVSNEEVDMLERVRDRGYRCYYHPEARVGHHVLSWRLTKRWFYRRYFWQGVSSAIMRRRDGRKGRLSQVLWGLGAALGLLARPHLWGRLLLPTNHPERFFRKCLACSAVGYVAGIWGTGGGP